MKKKKAFTLIELLAVIIILSVIAIIAVPTVYHSIQSSKEKTYHIQVSRIEAQAKKWAEANTLELPDIDNDSVFVTLSDLIKHGYVEDKDVLDPRTNTQMNGCVVIKFDALNSQYSYTYSEKDCTTLKEEEFQPEFTIQGIDDLNNLQDTVEVNTSYVYPHITAKDHSGRDLEVAGPVITEKGKDVTLKEVDTSVLDKQFELVYTTYDVKKDIEQKVVITVTVIDTTAPVITVNGHSSDFSMVVEASQSYEMPTAVVTDNSGLTPQLDTSGTVTSTTPGTYKITYTATDSKGNISTLILTIIIEDKTVPEVTILGNPTSWTNQSVTIAVNATDNGSGLAENPYSFDGGSTWQSGNTILVESNKTLMIWVKDNTGNIFKDNNVVINKIDKTIPDITFAVASGTTGTNYWYKSNVGLKITPTAGSSGVQEYSYCTTKDDSCAPSTKVSGSTVTTATLSNESATNKVCVSVTSVSGQTNSKCSGNYKIDKTAPVITVDGHISNYSVSFGPKQSYTIPTGTATDNLTSSVSVTKNGNVTPGTVGTYTVTYSAKDDAGNTKTLTLTVNVVAPTYSAWMTESELIAAGHTTSEYGIQSKTQYAYQDATTYSSTWTTTKPTYYKSKTQYKVTYQTSTYNPCCSTTQSCSGFNNTGNCGQNMPYTTCHEWSGGGCAASVCSSGTRCTDVCQGCTQTSNGTTDWQDSNTAPSGKTFVSSTTRTVYAEVTGWGSVTGWQDSAYTETPTKKVTTRTVYRYQTN